MLDLNGLDEDVTVRCVNINRFIPGVENLPSIPHLQFHEKLGIEMGWALGMSIRYL